MNTIKSKEPKYEVVRTLIEGEQNIIKRTDSEGNIKIVKHKKPIGYVMKNLKTEEFIAMTTMESVVEVLIGEATNVIAVGTHKRNNEVVPYIKSKRGYLALQDEDMILEVSNLEKEYKDIMITNKMKQKLQERLQKIEKKLNKIQGVRNKKHEQRKYNNKILLNQAIKLMNEDVQNIL